MDLNTFIIIIYCFIADWLAEQPRYRTRGPQPTVSDAEVLTIEVVGIWLGLATDKAIYLYFQRHYGEWFPNLCHVHRTTFVRQSANLWAVKVQLWRQLLGWIHHDQTDNVIDSMPLSVCRFARADGCVRCQPTVTTKSPSRSISACGSIPEWPGPVSSATWNCYQPMCMTQSRQSRCSVAFWVR